MVLVKPPVWASRHDRVAYVRDSEQCSLQEAKAIIAREDFEFDLYRAETVYDLQSVIAKLLPFVDFRRGQ